MFRKLMPTETFALTFAQQKLTALLMELSCCWGPRLAQGFLGYY